ncbi:MAG: LysE family translocator [Rhodospirillaceae bacterium]
MTLLWITFATGFGLGLAIAMPVGPVSLLCIQQCLTRGFRGGMAAGTGVALADATYAAIAAFGLTVIIAFLVGLQTPLRVAGLIAMLGLAWRIWREAGVPKHMAAAPGSGAATTLQMYVLTLANPMTILTFLALFVGAGVGLAGGYEYSAALTVGTFTGSFAWWIVLSGVVSTVRARLTDETLVWINRASAVIIAAFALWIGLKLVQGW